MSYSLNTKLKNYFTNEVSILKVSGFSLSDNESISFKIYSHITFYVFNLLYVFAVLYSISGAKISEDTEAISFHISSILGLIITATAKVHGKKLKELLKKLEEEPFLPNLARGGIKEEILTAKWLSLKTKQSFAFYVSVIIYMGSAIIYGSIKHITSDNPKDWIFCFGKLTVLDITDRINYKISFVYQIVCILILGMKVCGIMVIMYGTLSYACIQLQILQHYLQTIGKYHRHQSKDSSCSPSTNINANSSTSWTYLQPTLKQSVSYHQKILEIIAEVEEIFSIVILITYFAVLGALCILFYATSKLEIQDPRILTLIIASVGMGGFPLPVCYWGEQISHDSEQVAVAAYEAYFVESDLRFQKGLEMIIRRSQRTVRIKAGKFVETSMITYGWIIRTAFSYFMVLKNTKMES